MKKTNVNMNRHLFWISYIIINLIIAILYVYMIVNDFYARLGLGISNFSFLFFPIIFSIFYTIRYEKNKKFKDFFINWLILFLINFIIHGIIVVIILVPLYIQLFSP